MDLIEKTRDAVVHAGTTFSEDRLRAYKRALEIEEGGGNAVWALEQMIANSNVAASEGFPLCDDTGIPHVLLEIGEGRELDPNFFKDIERGIAEGLSKLPGRPMAVRDNDIEQKNGLYEESSMVRPVSFLINQHFPQRNCFYIIAIKIFFKNKCHFIRICIVIAVSYCDYKII